MTLDTFIHQVMDELCRRYGGLPANFMPYYLVTQDLLQYETEQTLRLAIIAYEEVARRFEFIPVLGHIRRPGLSLTILAHV